MSSATTLRRRSSFPSFFISKNRNIDVECDGDSYHNQADQIHYDKTRNNDLEAQNWSVLRFTTKHFDSQQGHILKKLSKTIKTNGDVLKIAELRQTESDVVLKIAELHQTESDIVKTGNSILPKPLKSSKKRKKRLKAAAPVSWGCFKRSALFIPGEQSFAFEGQGIQARKDAAAGKSIFNYISILPRVRIN